MPAEPDAQPLLVVSLAALPVLAEIERSTSATVALPVCSSCWRPITCTGLEASVSVRLMLEPVTHGGQGIGVANGVGGGFGGGGQRRQSDGQGRHEQGVLGHDDVGRW